MTPNEIYTYPINITAVMVMDKEDGLVAKPENVRLY
jgi:hypothetical protein